MEPNDLAQIERFEYLKKICSESEFFKSKKTELEVVTSNNSPIKTNNSPIKTNNSPFKTTNSSKKSKIDLVGAVALMILFAVIILLIYTSITRPKYNKL